MRKQTTIIENNIYFSQLRPYISAAGCCFYIDKNEAVKAYKASKIAKFPVSLPGEEAFANASISQSMHNSKVEEDFQIGVAVYDKNGHIIKKYPAKQVSYAGNRLSVVVEDFKYKEWSYALYCNDYIYTDKRAEKYVGCKEYGSFDQSLPLRASFDSYFDYEGDVKPNISYEDAFVYQLHVRGFTKHSSSGTRYKGTFRGVVDKLDYFKDLGVTTLEFQPVNEFNECDPKTGRLNYWGYCEGLYYAPKAAYSASNNPSQEFYSMVKAIHTNNQEVILQMFFPNSISRIEIVSILEYWTIKYHVDGFHLVSENAPLDLIDKSAVLSNSKIWCDRLDGVELVSCNNETADNRRYALYRDDYMYAMRRFLKADEFSSLDAISKLKDKHEKYASVNYFDAFNSLTMMDMVSYERKHNEENGEDNKDGSDYNCSWNCGEEGSTRKNKVVALRKKQIKNALMLLFISSGTPMIYMGDEFGRTQKGNNNPYCIDSAVTWVDWSYIKKQNNHIDYIKQLLDIRKEYRLIHTARELSMVDVSGCGYPEISFHGESAWKSQSDGGRHEFGIMYCDNGKLLYMAVNMHWESVVLSMPRPPKGYEWVPFLSTSTENDEKLLPNSELSSVIPEHTIALFTIKKAGDK